MYEELIMRIHKQAVYLPEKFSKNAELLDVLMKTADALEEMNKCLDGVCADNDSLCKQIEELSKPKWIPVTDRLPEPYIGEWLCYTKEDDILILPYDVPSGDCKEYMFYSFDDDDGYLYTKHNVTHWMPLPEPPKEET